MSRGRTAIAGKVGKVWSLPRFWVSICSYKKQPVKIFWRGDSILYIKANFDKIDNLMMDKLQNEINIELVFVNKIMLDRRFQLIKIKIKNLQNLIPKIRVLLFSDINTKSNQIHINKIIHIATLQIYITLIQLAPDPQLRSHYLHIAHYNPKYHNTRLDFRQIVR